MLCFKLVYISSLISIVIFPCIWCRCLFCCSKSVSPYVIFVYVLALFNFIPYFHIWVLLVLTTSDFSASCLKLKAVILSTLCDPDSLATCLKLWGHAVVFDRFHMRAKVCNLNYHSICAIWMIIRMTVFWTVCTQNYIAMRVWIAHFKLRIAV